MIMPFLGKNRRLSPSYVIDVATTPAVSHVVPCGMPQWYPPIMIGAETIAANLFDKRFIEKAIDLVKRLTPDDYTAFLIEFYADGLRRFGPSWRYADIVTVLLCLSEIIQPRTYLEIGVRRGRSAAAVASKAKHCSLVLLDMWMENYAGMENPGADFVRQELIRVGHEGPVRFIDGDSHRRYRHYFAKIPMLASISSPLTGITRQPARFKRSV